MPVQLDHITEAIAYRFPLIRARTRFMSGHLLAGQAVSMVASDRNFIDQCVNDGRDVHDEAVRMVERWRAELVRNMQKWSV